MPVSKPDETTLLPSGLTATAITSWSMPLKVKTLLPVAEVDQLHGAVLAGRDEVLAVGAEGDGVDEVGMRLVGLQQLELADVPEPDRLVEAGGGELLAVGAEGDGEDHVVVAAEHAEQLPVADLVEPQVALGGRLPAGDREESCRRG